MEAWGGGDRPAAGLLPGQRLVGVDQLHAGEALVPLHGDTQCPQAERDGIGMMVLGGRPTAIGGSVHLRL